MASSDWSTSPNQLRMILEDLKASGIVGSPVGGEPIDEAEHFEKCPECGTFFDMRDLNQVAQHIHEDDMLKTLDAHNSQRRTVHNIDLSEPTPNGIACPKCGTELMDSNPGFTLTSSPPQKNTECPSCGYHGLRIA